MCDTCHIIDWKTFLYMNKDELLDLYKEQKAQGKTVFVKGEGRYKGYWKLYNKGEATLIEQKKKG